MFNIYDPQRIGDRIKTERQAAKLSQDGLGAYIGVTRQTVAKWEKGADSPQLSDMLRLCNLFNCELGYLLCEYDCKTRAVTDIQSETGLSESAISNLREANKLQMYYAIFALNELLTYDNLSALDTLGQYLNMRDEWTIEGLNGERYKADLLIAHDVQRSIDNMRRIVQEKQTEVKSNGKH